MIGKQRPVDDEDRVLPPTATAAPLIAAVLLRAWAAAAAAKLHTVAPRSELPPSASCGADADDFFLVRGLLAPQSPQPLPDECGPPGSMDCKTWDTNSRCSTAAAGSDMMHLSCAAAAIPAPEAPAS